MSRSLDVELGTGTAARADALPSARPFHAVTGVRVGAAVGYALLGVLWLATHPHKGVVHDARLYAVQALRRLDPQAYANDLFFAFGSQDSFTIFSWLYDPVVHVLGLSQAQLLGAVVGQALWLASLLFLTRTLFDSPRERLLACAGVILLEPGYSALRTFQYAEAFTTPRIFAEALIMTALALLERRRAAAAGGALLLAGALHPLMALPGLGVALLRRPRKGVWLAALAAVAAIILAGLAGVEPFGRALATMDEPWFDVARLRSAHAFLSAWPALDLLRVLAKTALLGMAWALARPSERILLRAVLIATAVGLGATLLGADLLGDVLVVNLQPWRVLWLTMLLSNAWAAIVVLRLPDERLSRVALTLALAVSAASHLAGSADLSSPLVLTAGALLYVERRGTDALSPRVAVVVKGMILLLASSSLALLGLVLGVKAAFPGLPETLLAAAAAGGAALLLLRPPSSLARRVVFSLALLLLAGASVDRREGWTRFVDDPVVDADLRAFTANADRLYWEGAVDLTWLKLRRASYFSCLQGAGAMFYRGTATEFERRRRALAPVTTAPFDCSAQELAPAEELHRADLEAACRSLPELDALILTRDADGLATQRWSAPAPLVFPHDGEAAHVDVFYRYDCSRFR